MKAYEMSRYQKVIGTDGRISGTWVAIGGLRDRDELIVKPHNVVIYDETRTFGSVLTEPDLTAWVRESVVDIPKHMIAERVRYDVEEVWDEMLALMTLIEEAYRRGPTSPRCPHTPATQVDRSRYWVACPSKTIFRARRGRLTSGWGRRWKSDRGRREAHNGPGVRS